MILKKGMYLMKNGFNKNKRLKAFIFICAVSVLSLSTSKILSAQTITENIPLTFGKVVIIDNNAVREIELFPSGTFTADPEYIFFSEPVLANITVDGYAPFTTLSIDVSTTTLNKPGGGSAFFSVSDVFTNPAIVETDATGSATFEVGGTLSSNGSGAGFANADYEGIYSVAVTP